MTAADLPAEWAATADDPAWDAAIAASMNAAAAACGPSPASPTIVLGESGAGFAGPIFSSSLVGPAALRAWDAVSALLTEPGFIELRRPRTSPVPILAAAARAQPRRKPGPDGRVSRDA